MRNLVYALAMAIAGNLAMAKDSLVPSRILASDVETNILMIQQWSAQRITTTLSDNFSPSNNIPFTLALLKAVRQREILDAQPTLTKILGTLRDFSSTNYVRGTDYNRLLMYEFGKAVISLECAKLNLRTAESRADYLMPIMTNKLSQKKAITGELDLLEEDATELTGKMLGVLDTQANQSIADLALAVLRQSKAKTLEKDILTRIERHKGNELIFFRMLGILSEIGGDESLEYFIKLSDTRDARTKKALTYCLQLYRNRIKDPQVINRVIEAIKRLETP